MQFLTINVICCTCIGVRSVGSGWSDAGVSWLISRAQGKEMKVYLETSQPNSGTVPCVYLVDDGGHYIHSELVDAGHAVLVTGDNGVM